MTEQEVLDAIAEIERRLDGEGLEFRLRAVVNGPEVEVRVSSSGGSFATTCVLALESFANAKAYQVVAAIRPALHSHMDSALGVWHR